MVVVYVLLDVSAMCGFFIVCGCHCSFWILVWKTKGLQGHPPNRKHKYKRSKDIHHKGFKHKTCLVFVVCLGLVACFSFCVGVWVFVYCFVDVFVDVWCLF